MHDTIKLKSLLNREQLIAFLTEENNSYSHFILERINRDPLELYNIRTQNHHIIPEHRKGPDKRWNFITLSVEEHAMAHQLLYENYNYKDDLGASQMIRGQIEAGFETIREIARATMKEKNVSFYNREVQRELGSRKKKRAPAARNIYILAALSKGFGLQHTTSGEMVYIEPNECSSLVDVVEKLMAYPVMENKRESWNTCENKEKHYAITALTRTLTGHIDKKTKKSVFTFMSWRVLGINRFD